MAGGTVRQSRDVRKWLAARRAQKTLELKFERIDWEEDVLYPEIEALLSGKVRLELEAGSNKDAAESVIRVTVEDAPGSEAKP
jgi:hypothetical protein